MDLFYTLLYINWPVSCRQNPDLRLLLWI